MVCLGIAFFHAIAVNTSKSDTSYSLVVKDMTFMNLGNSSESVNSVLFLSTCGPIITKASLETGSTADVILIKPVWHSGLAEFHILKRGISAILHISNFY